MADGTSNRIGFDIVVDTKASDNNITTLKQDINNLQSAIEKVSKDSSINVSVDGTKKSFQELMTILDNTKNKFNQLMAQTEENQKKTAQAVQKKNLAIQKQQEKAYNNYIRDLQKKSDAHSRYIDKQTQEYDRQYQKYLSNTKVTTKASSDKVTTLKRDINNLQAAIEKASKTGLDINIDGVKRSIEKARSIQNEFYAKLDALNYNTLAKINKRENDSAKASIKAEKNKAKIVKQNLDMQAKAWADYDKSIEKYNADIDKKTQDYDRQYQQYLSNVKATQSKNSNIQQYKDLENSSKSFANQLKAQMQQEVSNETERYRVLNEELSIRSKLAKIQQRNADQEAKSQQKVGSNYFSQAKSGLQSEWMNNYYDYSKGNIGAREYAQNVSKIKLSAQELTKEINKMGVAFDNSTERGISFSNKLKSHLYWITAGTLLGAVTAIPYEVFTTLEKLDTGMAGMNQVIDHTAIATTAAKTGISEQTVAQSVLNNEQNKFIGIASTYGETIDKVIESGKRKLAA